MATTTASRSIELKLELDADTLARAQAAAAAAGQPLVAWLQDFIRERLAEVCPAPADAWRDLPEPPPPPATG